MALLRPLNRLGCPEATGEQGDLVCTTCHATVAQIESDLSALDANKTSLVTRIYEITTPDKPIQRVRLSDVFNEPIETEEAIDRVVESLRDHLMGLLDKGVKIIPE